MRIAIALEPPVLSEAPASWLSEALARGTVSFVTMPAIDPLARALADALAAHEPGEGDFIVLARAGAGRLSKEEWDRLGLAKSTRRLTVTEAETVEQLSALADESLLATTEALEQALALKPRDPALARAPPGQPGSRRTLARGGGYQSGPVGNHREPPRPRAQSSPLQPVCVHAEPPTCHVPSRCTRRPSPTILRRRERSRPSRPYS